MNYLGDFRLGDTLDFKFATTAAATGAPTTLSGTPVISAYPGNSTTELTAGITLTVDFDSRTGLNNVRVVATGGNGYATATNYALVITTGTVGGTSAVGYVVGTFSIEARSALMPTTAARTLDVAATGEAGLDFSNVLLTTGVMSALGATDAGTMQAGSAAGTAVLRAAASSSDDFYNGGTVYIYGGVGAGQARGIADYTGATRTCTLASNWITTPDNTSTYIVFGTAQASSGTLTASDVWSFATRQLTGTQTFNNTGTWTGNLSGSVGSVTGNVGGNVVGSTGSVTGAVGSVTGNIGGNVVGSVGSVTGSVTGSVGSVTGNVGGNVNGSVGSIASTPNVNVTTINGATVQGNGTGANLWRGV